MSSFTHHDVASAPHRVTVLREVALGRREIERFIRLAFARAYGANIHHFMPWLLSLRADDGEPQAALGFRFATRGRLFLEQYFDAPIEATLAVTTHAPLTREGVVEVGNLAVARAGGARWLVAALTAYLYGANHAWAVFTAVPALVNAFARLGIALIPLAAANITRLPLAERAAWGSYYDTQPMVMAANVAQSFRALTAYLDLPRDRQRLGPLCAAAYAAGCARPTA